jgi:Flp pilus assembly protein TadB
LSEKIFTKWANLMERLAGKIFSEKWCLEQDENASEELQRALKFTSLGLQPHQVNISALITSGLSFVICFIWALIFITILSNAEDGLFSIIIYAGFPLVLIPFIIAGWIGNYPMILEKRQRTATLGRLPEIVNYLVISMRLNPSLDRAIEFAAENAEGPMASSLRKVLWDVYLRKYDTVEQSLLAFADEWGTVPEFEQFKRGLYGIRAAQLESSEEGRKQALDKASETVTNGSRYHIEEYANTLSAPAMVLFGLGVMLPLILGAMLPMASSMSSSGGLSVFEILLLFDIIFPCLILGYSWWVVGNRPGTTPPPVIPDHRSKRFIAGTWIVAILSSIILFAIGILKWTSDGDGAQYLATIIILGAFILPTSIITLSGTNKRMKNRKDIISIEDEFPDALFQLGSRIAEGKPVERAIRDVGKSMGESSKTGDLMGQISHRTLISSASLNESLFGSDGLLDKYPSKTVKASMQTVVDVSSKDSVTAGRAIMGVSGYIRDLRSLEQDVRMKLGETMSMMETTARFFAPLVLGVTCAIFFLVANVSTQIPVGAFSADAGSLSGSSGGPDRDFDNIADSKDICPDKGGRVDDDGCPIPPGIQPWQFLAIIGFYLMFLTVVIAYFTSSIKSGEDLLERRYSTGTALLVGYMVFALTAWLAKATIA